MRVRGLRALGLRCSAVALLSAAAVAVVGCAGSGLAQGEPVPLESGIEGQVVLAPACRGPARVGQACTAPYETTIAVLDWQGTLVTEVRTGADGTFRVLLGPETYTLHPAPAVPGPFPWARDVTVTVEPGQFTQVTVTYDTGMR